MTLKNTVGEETSGFKVYIFSCKALSYFCLFVILLKIDLREQHFGDEWTTYHRHESLCMN